MADSLQQTPLILTENPTTDIAESSTTNNQTTEINYSFYLVMKPARKLRLAIEALVDVGFNSRGVGVFGADHRGLGFNVQNLHQDTAFLRLDNTMFFKSNKPIVGWYLPLALISQKIPDAFDSDDDTITVFHVLGSNELSFELGTTPLTKFSVQFIVVSTPIDWYFFSFPNCSINVPTKHLRQMIDYMLQANDLPTKTASVLVDKKQKIARIEIGSIKTWEYNHNENKVSGTMELKPEQCERASFNWTYATFLYKASFMGFEFQLQFLSFPEERIMFRFRINELGELMIAQKALMKRPLTTDVQRTLKLF